MDADVGAVVVTHGTGGEYEELVDALLREGFPHESVTVVHAAGSSLVMPSGVEILGTKTDHGFPHAANVGIRRQLARGVDYVLILPHDVRFDRGALRNLINTGRRATRYGILAPVVWHRDEDRPFSFGASIDPSGAHVHERVRPALPTDEHGVAQTTMVDGAAMLVRESVFRDAGLLNERLFLYVLEFDFCTRAAALGWSTGVVVDARVEQRPANRDPALFDYYLTRDVLEYAWSSRGMRGFIAESGRTVRKLLAFLRVIGSPRSKRDVRLEYAWRLLASVAGGASFVARDHRPAPRWVARRRSSITPFQNVG